MLGASGCVGDSGFVAGDEVQLSVSPNVVEFAAISLGTSVEQIVEVTHIGAGGVLALRGAWLDGGGDDLSLEGPTDVDLAAGDSAAWTLRYAPTDAAPDAATLRIGHNLAIGGAIEVPVATVGQAAALLPDPAVVDFGTVAPGGAATREIVLRNVGSQAVTVVTVVLDAAGSPDFQVVSTAAGAVDPGGEIAVTVGYTPAGRDIDEATLRVVTGGGLGHVLVPLVGREAGPVVLASPAVLDLGAVAWDRQVVRSVALVNVGSGALIVQSLELTGDAGGALWVGGQAVAALPIELGAQETAWLDVGFAPDSETAVGALEADLLVLTNDASQPTLVLPLLGIAGAPVLEVSPLAVDFGEVGSGVEASRTVTVLNAGQTPLDVSSVALDAPAPTTLSLSTEAAFDDGPGSLLPGETTSVTLRVLHGGGADLGPLLATLRVVASDPERPEVAVSVAAHAVEEATCEPVLSPLVNVLGGVPSGKSLVAHAGLLNAGTGLCHLQTAWIDRCGADGIVQTCFDGEASPEFSLQAALPPGAEIGPGETLLVPVRFDAPLFSGSETGFDRYYGRLVVLLDDPQLDAAVTVPAGSGTWQPGPNLIADSGTPRIDVYPDRIDFGLVPVGCSSPAALVTLHSGGAIPVTVTELALTDCDDGFSLVDPPAVPWSLAPGAPLGLSPAFQAHLPGPHSCVLRVTSTDPGAPMHDVELLAEATPSGSVTEIFAGQATPQVDVLFVVDDSGSMSAEQASLAANFDAFIHAAEDWETDYRIGVTTTDLTLGGALQGSSPIVTAANAEQFKENVLVGTAGSLVEQGLAAASASLTGAFAPFLRPDAALVMVFVSDEDDQSAGPVSQFVTAFRSIKSGQDELLTAYAIVGPPGGCLEGGGSAEGGLRYIQAAEETGGAFASICDPSFGSALQTFGEGTFGPRSSFALAGTPKPGTLEVLVDGVLCDESAWTLTGGGRTVHFASDSPCLPADGADVKVSYELFCL